MKRAYARRQIAALLMAAFVACFVLISQQDQYVQPAVLSSEQQEQYFGEQSALEALDSLAVKGRSPKTGYSRAQFGGGWSRQGLCDMRNIILARDLTGVEVDEQCRVLQGVLSDPYTGEVINFQRGESSSQEVQIDHVVALSDAWQKGAQALTYERRVEFSNDPLNLLAVSGPANQQKGDGDAATWLPANKSFRCQYVARQVAVKNNYELWVTEAERGAMADILQACTSDR